MGRVSMLCNDAEIRQEEGRWKVEGDPTEGALYPFGNKLGLERQAEQTAYPRIDAIPFESEHRFMATLHKDAAGKQFLLVKGAPEVILEHCDRQATIGGGPVPLDRGHFAKASDELAAQGERVLALAWLEDPGRQCRQPRPGGSAEKPGPARPDRVARSTADGGDRGRAECHAGGIRVTMITGDHKITAAAIAKMLGIGDGSTAITGSEIEEMDTATLQERVRDVDVFARASPEHKLRLVKAIQANKQIVAMTGDGVNDAPSLKKADVGVAMGIKGTEVTKEAAEMVLADDNFASITAAVKEGRTVYNNIEKAILFMLPTNVAQALVIMAAIFIGFTAPITAPQILWVNMVTSVALGLVISFEPHELDVMQRLPRAVDRPILDAFGVWRVVFVGLALLALTLMGVLLDEVEECVRRTRSRGRRERARDRPGLLSAQQPLQARFVTVSQGAPRQQVFGDGDWRGGDLAAPVHLHSAVPRALRDRGNSAVGLAMAFAGGLVFFLVVEAEKLIIRLARRSRGAPVLAGLPA